MAEIDKYEAYKKKLQGICDENNLVFRFRTEAYPITLTIRPVSGAGEQLTMLECMGESSYTSPNASLVFSYRDGAVIYKTSETLTIGDALFSKLKNLFKNMVAMYLQYFYRELITNGAIPKNRLPVIDEEQHVDEPDPEAPAPGEEMPDDSEAGIDEDLIANAIQVVRLENKASVALLQRRLNIGYTRATNLMQELEQLGVVGPYNGGEPREVLPDDEPDDFGQEDNF